MSPRQKVEWRYKCEDCEQVELVFTEDAIPQSWTKVTIERYQDHSQPKTLYFCGGGCMAHWFSVQYPSLKQGKE